MQHLASIYLVFELFKMVAGNKPHLNSTFFLLHYTCLRVICLCRCFWSARMPSDRVPSGRPGQAVCRTEQSCSGGLHKLLPACAQVGSYSHMLAFASEGFDTALTWTRCFGSKKLEKECLVSVVADLRQASLPTVRFITETLLLLEVLGIEHAFLLLICSRFSRFAGISTCSVETKNCTWKQMFREMWNVR